MDSYNILNEPWIRVKYIDGTIDEIGVRKAFKDAKQIEKILPPVFRRNEIDYFCYTITKLLSTIVMSAYYKKETNFASKNRLYLEDLYKNGIYSDVLRDYLDKYEDRFDILSETHPFLQNILIKKDNDEKVLCSSEDKKYLTWNPLAPGYNNKVFGRLGTIDPDAESVIDQFKINKKECIYMLLYIAFCGSTPSANSSEENALGRKYFNLIFLESNNLANTVILNTYPLKSSSRPDEDYLKEDKPVWEMDNVLEINEYGKNGEDITKNILCRTFFPGISVLNMGFDDDGYLKGMYRIRISKEEMKRRKEKKARIVKAKEEAKKNKEKYVEEKISLSDIAENKDEISISPVKTDIIGKYFYEPAVIVRRKKNKKGEIDKEYYEYYDPKNIASKLCICATEHTNSYNNCMILDNLNNLDFIEEKQVYIYYRNMDDKLVNLLEFGYISGKNPETWKLLEDEDIHNLALYYQDIYGKIYCSLRYSLMKVYGVNKSKDGIKFVDDVIKEFSDWMEDDFFGTFTEDISNENYEAIKKNLEDRISRKALMVFDNYSKMQNNFLASVKEKKFLRYNINGILGINIKKDKKEDTNK